MLNGNLINIQNSKKNKVNIIPLIDIIFLMLIFFMLATNFSQNEEIDLSISDSAISVGAGTKTMYVIIKDSGKFIVDKKEYSKDKIEKIILKNWNENKYDEIFILNEKNVNTQKLIFLLDILKKNKLTKIYFDDLND
tara:strand:+ start:344 stop:754 length:411 start_codon:yes stop_codon:yes gene_type:complete